MEKKQELKIENNFNVDDIKKKLYKAISISDLASKEVTHCNKAEVYKHFFGSCNRLLNNCNAQMQ